MATAVDISLQKEVHILYLLLGRLFTWAYFSLLFQSFEMCFAMNSDIMSETKGSHFELVESGFAFT